jgi:hypothetical protein
LPSAVIEPGVEGVPSDLNRDGAVTPLDVLFVVNALNSTVGNSPADEPPTVDGVLVPDVNEDGQLTPLDALLVANWINQAGHSSGALATALDGGTGRRWDGVGETGTGSVQDEPCLSPFR